MGKKEKIGIVVNDKNQKTLNVLVQTRYSHFKYKKIILQTKHYSVHDEKNQGHIGDLVLIEEIAPISKTKVWALKKILRSYKF